MKVLGIIMMALNRQVFGGILLAVPGAWVGSTWECLPIPVNGQEEVSLQQYRRHSGSHGGRAVARPSNTAQRCCATSHAARPFDERGRIEHLRGNFPIAMPLL
jgi:hypothetical protein